jgi:hypothetical protein
MKAVLVERDLYAYMEMGKADIQKNADTKKGGVKCKARMLLMTESEELAMLVDEAETPKEAYEALKKEYQGQQRHRRSALLQEVRCFQQDTDETSEVYSDRAMGILHNLKDAEVESADILMTDAFIQGIREDVKMCCFAGRRVAVCLSQVVEKFKDLTRLLGHSNGPSREASGKAFKANIPVKRRCHNCGKRGHLAKDCWCPRSART